MPFTNMQSDMELVRFFFLVHLGLSKPGFQDFGKTKVLCLKIVVAIDLPFTNVRSLRPEMRV